ncbi:MAG: hypothetical protein NTY26_14115 [Burkholderiales bacterium]|nr:hypothetical protein [Burkholderiales bacterium]
MQPSETLQADVTVNAPAARQTPHRIRLSGIDAPEKAQPYEYSPGKACQTWWWAEVKNQVGAGDFTFGHQH